MVKIENIKNFDIDSTITCGEIFRYNKELDGSYTIILIDRVINIKYINNTLHIESNDYNDLENIILEYFDFKSDYQEINDYLLNKNNNIKDIIDSSNGFRIIKSYPLETIISYIISSNNKVSRIKESVDLLSKKYGKRVVFKDKEYYLFPTIEELKDLTIEDYRTCKTGFRDKYLKSIVNKLYNDKDYINRLNELRSIDAYNLLQKEKGIGPKVASCILLFAYQKQDVYPIDTWVKKYMKDKYNIEKEKDIRIYIHNLYDKYSGIVIQYMFNYKRNTSQK